MDLKKLDVISGANEGADVRLKHPGTGDDLGIVIHVLGRDSAVFHDLADKQNKRRISRMTRGGVFRAQALPASEIEKDALELLVACTQYWYTEAKVDDAGTEVEPRKDSIEFDGQFIDGTAGNAQLAENARMIYSRLPWAREQVDVEVNDRANFVKS